MQLTREREQTKLERGPNEYVMGEDMQLRVHVSPGGGGWGPLTNTPALKQETLKN